MEITQIATRQVNNNSTTITGDADTTDGNYSISRTVLAIMIPILIILAAAIVGLASYFILCMRRRRLRRKAQRDENHTDMESLTAGPAMEEGFNELGEAPPPYVLGRRVKERTNHEEMEDIEEVEETDEVLDEPTEPPPAYIAEMALARTRVNTL